MNKEQTSDNPQNQQLNIAGVRVSTYITCSAIWFKDGIHHDHQPFNIETGFVICGHRHHNCFMTAYILNDNEKVKNIQISIIVLFLLDNMDILK